MGFLERSFIILTVGQFIFTWVVISALAWLILQMIFRKQHAVTFRFIVAAHVVLFLPMLPIILTKVLFYPIYVFTIQPEIRFGFWGYMDFREWHDKGKEWR